VEEEDSVGAIVDKLEKAGREGLYILDKELGQRGQ